MPIILTIYYLLLNKKLLKELTMAFTPNSSIERISRNSLETSSRNSSEELGIQRREAYAKARKPSQFFTRKSKLPEQMLSRRQSMRNLFKKDKSDIIVKNRINLRPDMLINDDFFDGECNEKVTSLDLTSSTATSLTIFGFSKLSKKFPNLETLILDSNYSLYEPELKPLFKVKHLTSISVENCPHISDRFVGKHTKLTRLF